MNFKKLMDEIFKLFNNNLNKYQNKIEELKNKKQILNRNKFTSKIYILLISCLISWFIIMLILFILYIKGINLSFLEILICLVLALIIGIISTIIFYQTKKYKVKMLKFLNSQNQEEILKEEIKCDLEIAKIKSQIIMLNRCLELIKQPNIYLEYILQNYKITCKKIKSLENREYDFEQMRKELCNYQEKINNINNKNYLFNVFKPFKNKIQKILNLLLYIIIGLSGGLLFTLPLFFKIKSLISIIPPLAGGIIGYIIIFAKTKIYLNVFNSLKKELAKESFPKNYQYYKKSDELENIIEKSCELAIIANLNYFTLEELKKSNKH